MTRVHLLDVGRREYGDAVLCELGTKRVLIDGAHKGDQEIIAQQLRDLLGGPAHVDLLIVTHAHQDHIGCLPHLVKNGVLTAKWALVADPGLGWGRSGEEPPPVDAKVSRVVAALREEVPSEDFEQVLLDAVTLEESYADMLAKLAADGTKVVRYGRDSHAALVRAFRSIGLKILGPSETQLLVCAETIADRTRDALDAVQHLDAAQSDVELYRALLESPLDSLDAERPPGPADQPPERRHAVQGRRREAAVRGRHAVRRSAGGRPAAAQRARQAARGDPARGAVRAREALPSRQPERLQPRRSG